MPERTTITDVRAAVQDLKATLYELGLMDPDTETLELVENGATEPFPYVLLIVNDDGAQRPIPGVPSAGVSAWPGRTKAEVYDAVVRLRQANLEAHVEPEPEQSDDEVEAFNAAYRQRLGIVERVPGSPPTSGYEISDVQWVRGESLAAVERIVAILETEPTWSAETLDAAAGVLVELGFARVDDAKRFRGAFTEAGIS